MYERTYAPGFHDLTFVYASHPKEVADVIESAARAVSK